MCFNAFGIREVATIGVLQEKVFLEIPENSQENTCARVSFLIKLPACEISKNTFFTDCFCTKNAIFKFL